MGIIREQDEQRTRTEDFACMDACIQLLSDPGVLTGNAMVVISNPLF